MEDSEDEEISEDEENIFMKTVTSEYDLDMEWVVDLKAELISALEEIQKCRKNNKQSNQIISDWNI